ncbi:hypothetical protein EV360DRAFT_74461 [Lentinula raphanica]|nr:hypothetical protein EV360DRAFT_74461 [Lentinula raphanica]
MRLALHLFLLFIAASAAHASPVYTEGFDSVSARSQDSNIGPSSTLEPARILEARDATTHVRRIFPNKAEVVVFCLEPHSKGQKDQPTGTNTGLAPRSQQSQTEPLEEPDADYEYFKQLVGAAIVKEKEVIGLKRGKGLNSLRGAPEAEPVFQPSCRNFIPGNDGSVEFTLQVSGKSNCGSTDRAENFCFGEVYLHGELKGLVKVFAQGSKGRKPLYEGYPLLEAQPVSPAKSKNDV